MRKVLSAALLAAGILAAGAAASAQAQVLQRYSTGTWTIEANASGGSFQNCSAMGRYTGGASVIFMLTRNLQWGLGIQNPSWTWRPGSTGAVAYWVDGGAPRTSTARATAPTRLVLSLADSTQLFQEIRRGQRMYFRPHGHNTFSMTLNGTSAALAELLSCVRRFR